MNEYIYEAVDNSDDEKNYALGLFLTEADALECLDHPEPLTDSDGNERVTFQIRRRMLGFHPNEYSVIASRTWVQNFSEEKGDTWEAKPIVREIP